MTNPTWELVKIARTRAMADRLQAQAFDRADAAGFTEANGRSAYALGWLAHEAARRIVELEDARDVPTRGQGAAAHSPPTKQGGGVLHLHAVEPRASRR